MGLVCSTRLPWDHDSTNITLFLNFMSTSIVPSKMKSYTEAGS